MEEKSAGPRGDPRGPAETRNADQKPRVTEKATVRGAPMLYSIVVPAASFFT
jgi:hypothetical protein